MLLSKMTNKSPQIPYTLITVLLWAALIGYSLPWIQTLGVSFQSGAYDLAEWMTLHPTVRSLYPNWLYPALFLRLALWTLGVSGFLLFTLSVHKHYTWRLTQLILATGVWVALIPSIAFFQGQWSDANYLQQFILWMSYSAICAAIAVIPARLRAHLHWGLVFFGILSGAISAYALWTAQDLLSRYQINIGFGSGAIIYIGMWLAIILILIPIKTKRG